MLSRRKFLTMAGGAAATGTAVWAGLVRDHAGGVPAAAPTTTTLAAPAAAAGRVLVVVQLSGGNDGLNTLVPLDGRYHDLRPTLGLADDTLVPLTGETAYGLHPSLSPLGARWDSGDLAFMDAIGYEGSSRSHFQALSTWWTGSPDSTPPTGWLGRWLDLQPDAADNPLVAISIGGGGAPSLRAEHTLSTTIADVSAFALRAPVGSDATAVIDAFLATAGPLADEPVFASAQRAVTASVDAVQTLSQALPTAARGDAAPDPQATPITSSLQVAANLIGLDIGTRILLVGSGGFDTHANQAGQHGTLLADAAGGITSFLTTLDERGLADRVLVVTTSEFGRRAAENGSGGTDHGKGGVQLVAGSGGLLKGGQIVGAPNLAGLVDGDVQPTVDVRSLYAVALDWLGGPTDDILGGQYDRYALVAS